MLAPLSKRQCNTALPIVHSLAIVYLMLPVVIWLLGWFQLWLSIPVALMLALAHQRVLLPFWKESSRPAGTVVLLLLIALGWVMLTSAGGIIDLSNPDTEKHHAIYLELARSDWPVFLPTYFDFPVLLRYNLAYYMVPGLLAKWLGLAVLNWSVPLWTWCGTALALLLFTRGHGGWKAIAAATIFIFFSDISPTIPPWSTGEYWSMFRHLMYTPQHFIAGALYTLLVIDLRRNSQFIGVSGVVLAGSLFWSPLVAVGLLPLVMVMVWQSGIRSLLTWQNLVAAPALVSVLLLYLSSGFSSISGGWGWERYGWNRMVERLDIFIAFLVLAFLVMFLRTQLRREPLFLVCLAVLALAPWYSYGFHNDWPWRVSLPAMVVICYFCAKSIVSGWTDYQEIQRRTVLALVMLLLVVGAALSSWSHLSRAVSSYDLSVFRYDQIDQSYSILQAVEPEVHDQYVVPVDPWLFELLRQDGRETVLDRGNLIVASDFEVYLSNRRLVYIRTPCKPEDLGHRFILHIFPVDGSLIGNREHDTFDFYFGWKGAWISGTCMIARDLPEYEIASIKTGQFTGGASPTGHEWLVRFYMER